MGAYFTIGYFEILDDGYVLGEGRFYLGMGPRPQRDVGTVRAGLRKYCTTVCIYAVMEVVVWATHYMPRTKHDMPHIDA